MSANPFKIGVDLHGVLDRWPKIFSAWSAPARAAGFDLHVVTGMRWEEARPKVNELGFQWSHHFSILDFHIAKGYVKVRRDGDGNLWIPDDEWNRAKGEYAREAGLEIHFDDDMAHGCAFPESCVFVHLGSRTSPRMLERMLYAVIGEESETQREERS